MVRIRYTELDNGLLQSGWLFAGHAMVKVEINLRAKSIRIYNEKHVCLIQVQKLGNKVNCYKVAKEKARELGVNFYDEVRAKVIS